MSEINLYEGDCIEKMRELPNNSVDSIVTDPPYELGFMGKKWDSTGIAYNVDVWKECLRVLKPGGHLLAFGGTRTYHRMACAIEDAGFEIRDQAQWLYGCLSEDTEILTLNGWKKYSKGVNRHPILCYDVVNGDFEFHIPERSFIYENQHTAYHIQSDSTDQIVSRNHRCIIERDGRKVFAYAETLEQQENVPFLESLFDLPDTIPYTQQGTSVAKQDLLKRVRKQEHQREKYGETTTGAVRGESLDNVCSMRQSGVETKSVDKESRETYLQSALQRSASRRGMEETRTQRTFQLESRIGNSASREDDGRNKPCVERRNNIPQKTWKLCRGKIRSLSKGVSLDGSKGWVCDGTSADCGENIETMPVKNGSRTPYRSQPRKQQPVQLDAFFQQPTPQEIRGNRETGTTLATVTPIEYKGNVWCVLVPTGAFVARRNGHIFITGNSGFPKSMDISKAIDKKSGVKREIIGTIMGKGGQNLNQISRDGKNDSNDAKGCGAYGIGAKQVSVEIPITAPETEEAKRWDGWGTALKPSNEPICIARKPISEKTVAENVLKWGTGGLNIDACRIGYECGGNAASNPLFGSQNGYKINHGADINSTSYQLKRNTGEMNINPVGRFPSNVILDEEAGKMLDEQSGISKSTGGRTNNAIRSNQRIYGKGVDKLEIRDPGIGDVGGASRFFYCAKASKSERNAGLVGMEKKTAGSLNFRNPSASGRSEDAPSVAAMGGITKAQENHHPTVKPVKLMEYLVKLVTPPNGTTLDPFMGSGSTGVACRNLGINFIGIDKEHDYVEIANRRIQQGSECEEDDENAEKPHCQETETIEQTRLF